MLRNSFPVDSRGVLSSASAQLILGHTVRHGLQFSDDRPTEVEILENLQPVLTSAVGYENFMVWARPNLYAFHVVNAALEKLMPRGFTCLGNGGIIDGQRTSEALGPFVVGVLDCPYVMCRNLVDQTDWIVRRLLELFPVLGMNAAFKSLFDDFNRQKPQLTRLVNSDPTVATERLLRMDLNKQIRMQANELNLLAAIAWCLNGQTPFSESVMTGSVYHGNPVMTPLGAVAMTFGGHGADFAPVAVNSYFSRVVVRIPTGFFFDTITDFGAYEESRLHIHGNPAGVVTTPFAEVAGRP